MNTASSLRKRRLWRPGLQGASPYLLGEEIRALTHHSRHACVCQMVFREEGRVLRRLTNETRVACTGRDGGASHVVVLLLHDCRFGFESRSTGANASDVVVFHSLLCLDFWDLWFWHFANPLFRWPACFFFIGGGDDYYSYYFFAVLFLLLLWSLFCFTYQVLNTIGLQILKRLEYMSCNIIVTWNNHRLTNKQKYSSHTARSRPMSSRGNY